MKISISIPMTYDTDNSNPTEAIVLQPSGNGFVPTVDITIGGRTVAVRLRELTAALDAFSRMA